MGRESPITELPEVTRDARMLSLEACKRLVRTGHFLLIMIIIAATDRHRT
jgi:hypothetical protein